MTASDTPYSHEPPPRSPEAQALDDAISDAVWRQLEARNQLIESAVLYAYDLGVGVRVKTYLDGRTEARPDSTVPAGNLYEEHPDQPHYGMRFEDD